MRLRSLFQRAGSRLEARGSGFRPQAGSWPEKPRRFYIKLVSHFRAPGHRTNFGARASTGAVNHLSSNCCRLSYIADRCNAGASSVLECGDVNHTFKNVFNVVHVHLQSCNIYLLRWSAVRVYFATLPVTLCCTLIISALQRATSPRYIAQLSLSNAELGAALPCIRQV